MERLKSIEITGTGESYYLKVKYQVPRKCPHCLHSISVKILDRKTQILSKKEHANFFIHNCPECTKNFITVHLRDEQERSTQFLYCYPSHIKHEHSAAIKKHFPRFVEVYDQAYFAEQMNHQTIAGAGYRLSLEILLKDFAVLKFPEQAEKIKKTSLNNCIQEYYKDFDESVIANVVRKLGNDYSHYNQEFSEVEFSEIKEYLDLFVLNVEMKLRILDPVVPV